MYYIDSCSDCVPRWKLFSNGEITIPCDCPLSIIDAFNLTRRQGRDHRDNRDNRDTNRTCKSFVPVVLSVSVVPLSKTQLFRGACAKQPCDALKSWDKAVSYFRSKSNGGRSLHGEPLGGRVLPPVTFRAWFILGIDWALCDGGDAIGTPCC